MVEASASPSTRSGRKWRWKAATTVRVAPIVDAAELDAVAIEREHRLQRPDRRPFLTHGEQRAADDRRRLAPMADAAARERVPGEFLAGIALALGCDVGMGENAFATNGAPRRDVAAQRDDGVDLPARKRRQRAVMAGIDDLDADRSGIEIALAAPEADAGVPGALVLGRRVARLRRSPRRSNAPRPAKPDRAATPTRPRRSACRCNAE